MERWKGRVAVVTGASAGIGAAITKALVRRGMRVVGMARRVEKIQELSAELKVEAGNAGGELHAVQVDLSVEAELEAAVAWVRTHLGGIDVLINNAGVFHSTSLAGDGPDPLPKWRSMLDLNLIALSVLTRAAVQDMRSRGVNDGHIVHIGSIMGTKVVDYAGSYAYSGIKHALSVMTEGLRRELRDMGTKIRVTNLSPGFVRTDWWVANGLTKEESEQMYKDNPYLEVNDIADAVIFALGAPAHVQIHQLTIQPVGESF